MFYYFYFLEKENFEYALNNLNDGISEEILDYYFENFDKIYIEHQYKAGSIIIDYFFKYIHKLYYLSKNKNIKFQDYLFDLCVNKNFDSKDKKFKNIYESYLLYLKKHSDNINMDELFKYCNEKYLHLEKINEEKKIEDIKNTLYLNKIY